MIQQTDLAAMVRRAEAADAERHGHDAACLWALEDIQCSCGYLQRRLIVNQDIPLLTAALAEAMAALRDVVHRCLSDERYGAECDAANALLARFYGEKA